MPVKTPWAVLLCKFSDDPVEPRSRDFYERLFTEVGRGSSNMVDFFDDVSHGAVDLAGSKVFGWYTLPKKRSDYKGSGPNPKGRDDLVAWAKAAAKADPGDPVDVDDGSWFGVVVSMNVSTDLFGAGGRAVCDLNSLEPSLLGQEMGHGYGLAHSRADGSTADYEDPWDVMSTAAAYMAPHADYGHVGPGLNAANMAGRSWLDEKRVWSPSSETVDSIVSLRPIHSRGLAGYLAARLGDFLIEFRMKAAWDAAIRVPAVLVHRFEDNQSYIMRGKSGRQDLEKGDFFEVGTELGPTGPLTLEWTRVEPVDIDTAGRRATLRLRHRAPSFSFPPTYPLPWPVIRRPGPEFVFGDSRRDGGAIILEDRLVSVSRQGVSVDLLREIAAMEASALISEPETRAAARRDALSAIARRVESELAELNPYSVPAPPLDPQSEPGNLPN